MSLGFSFRPFSKGPSGATSVGSLWVTLGSLPSVSRTFSDLFFGRGQGWRGGERCVGGAELHDVQSLSSLTGDGAWAPCTGSLWTARDVLSPPCEKDCPVCVLPG